MFAQISFYKHVFSTNVSYCAHPARRNRSSVTMRFWCHYKRKLVPVPHKKSDAKPHHPSLPCFIPSLSARFAEYHKPRVSRTIRERWHYPMCVAGIVGVSVVTKAFQSGQWLLSSSTMFVGGERHNCHAMGINCSMDHTEAANLQSSSFQVIWLYPFRTTKCSVMQLEKV